MYLVYKRKPVDYRGRRQQGAGRNHRVGAYPDAVTHKGSEFVDPRLDHSPRGA